MGSSYREVADDGQDERSAMNTDVLEFEVNPGKLTQMVGNLTVDNQPQGGSVSAAPM